MAHDASNLVLTKQQVAERQLNTAIQIFFDEGDPVSIHTLTSAVYEILSVLTGKDRAFEILIDSAVIRPEKKKEFIAIFTKAQNFFKHSGRDASKSMEFSPFQTEIMLYDCVRMYKHLSGQTTAETHVYEMWFMMKYPEYFHYKSEPEGPLSQLFSSMADLGVDPTILKRFSRVIASLKETGEFPKRL